ncbi:MAG: DUF4190 domain-containing protein [Candidatus Limnocylindrales bacterium]
MSDTSGGPGWWQAADGKWYPPAGPGLLAPPRSTNGLATAALVLGIVGAVLGLVPFLFFLAFVCGVLGIVFGFIGRSRSVESGVGRKSATAGLITGAVAVVLAIIGVVILVNVGEDAVDELDKIGRCLDNPELAEC